MQNPVLLLLVILLALAPLPFGAVTPEWKSALASASFLILAVFLTLRFRHIEWPPHGVRTLSWAAGMFALVIIWAAFQSVSFSPEGWHHPAWTVASGALGKPIDGAISINPAATVTDLLSLVGTAAIFLVVVYEARDASKARFLLTAMAAIGMAYAIFGLAIFFSGNEWVAWAPKRYYTDSLSGTFVNRNTYGIYAGLSILAATALVASQLAPILTSRRRRPDKIRDSLSYLTGRGGLWIVAILVGASALILTGSRAASTASAVGLLSVLALYFAARRTSVTAVAFGVLIILVAAFSLFQLSGDSLLGRFGEVEGSWDYRNSLYERVYVAIQDHLWLGAGYGAFEDVYRMYAGLTRTFGPDFRAAHNVFLEMTLELGIPAAVLFFASLGILVATCARAVFVRRRDRIFPAVAVAATVIIAIQGAVDFAIQTPAVATLYAALLGLGVAQSRSQRSR